MREIKKVIHYIKLRWKNMTSILEIKSIEKKLTATEKPLVALIGTPEYCNLGDHLIAFAIIKFWEQYFPDDTVIEFTRECCERNSQKICSILENKPFRVILITGGGFLGDLWPDMQILVNRIINASKNRRIIIFPQTIYYQKTYENNLFFLNDRKAYQSANHLTIFVRDRKSYDFLIETNMLKTSSIHLVPDMALFLSPTEYTLAGRSGIFLCFRHDKECTLSDSEESYIKTMVKSMGITEISTGDTVDKYSDFLPKHREEKITNFMNKLCQQQLVITNRLHCMIFCYLSSTPCIALDNISHKISGVFQWLSECNYLKCVSFEYITPSLINEMLECIPEKFAGAELSENFLTMAKIMEEYDD